MPEIIDACSHIISEAVLDELDRVHPNAELSSLRNAPRMFAEAERIDYLDRNDIDRQVINLAAPMIWVDADPEAVVDAARLANDEVRRVADDYPDRFIPTGTLPFLTGEYVDEARRCVEELGFNGLQIFSNIDGQLLDDPAFEPFWETVDDLDVPVWIHPQLHDWHDYDEGSTWIYKMLGWPFDTSLAMGRLVFGGVLSAFPDLAVVPHHTGAMIPHFIDRIEQLHRMSVEYRDLYPFTVTDLRGTVREQFGRFYADTARAGATGVLEDAFEFYGPDRLVFATDYPFGPEEGRAFLRAEVNAVEAMDVTAQQRSDVFGGNIEAIL